MLGQTLLMNFVELAATVVAVTLRSMTLFPLPTRGMSSDVDAERCRQPVLSVSGYFDIVLVKPHESHLNVFFS